MCIVTLNSFSFYSLLLIYQGFYHQVQYTPTNYFLGYSEYIAQLFLSNLDAIQQFTHTCLVCVNKYVGWSKLCFWPFIRFFLEPI